MTTGQKTLEEQQLANVEAVKGTPVKVKNPNGGWSKVKLHIVDYYSPLVWKLDHSIYGSEFHHDRHVRTLDGKRLHELVPEPTV